MCDLLWSDPQPQNGRGFSKRGVGIQFGPDITEQFCAMNKLDYIIRSHEVKAVGYEVAHNGKCITVFSAPNYWWFSLYFFRNISNFIQINYIFSDTMDNLGAFITLFGTDMTPNFTTYEAVRLTQIWNRIRNNIKWMNSEARLLRNEIRPKIGNFIDSRNYWNDNLAQMEETVRNINSVIIEE